MNLHIVNTSQSEMICQACEKQAKTYLLEKGL